MIIPLRLVLLVLLLPTSTVVVITTSSILAVVVAAVLLVVIILLIPQVPIIVHQRRWRQQRRRARLAQAQTIEHVVEAGDLGHKQIGRAQHWVATPHRIAATRATAPIQRPPVVIATTARRTARAEHRVAPIAATRQHAVVVLRGGRLPVVVLLRGAAQQVNRHGAGLRGDCGTRHPLVRTQINHVAQHEANARRVYRVLVRVFGHLVEVLVHQVAARPCVQTLSTSSNKLAETLQVLAPHLEREGDR